MAQAAEGARHVQRGGVEAEQVLSANAGVRADAGAVGLDELLDLTSATWMDVNDLWRRHLRYLFAKFALVFEVVQEMKFRDDFEREDTDCVLVQIQQTKGSNFIWRPARVVSKAFVGHGIKPLTEEERRMQKYKRGAADKEARIDLRPFMDPSPYVVNELMPLRRVYKLFNMIGEGEGFTMAEMTSTMGPWFGKFTAAKMTWVMRMVK